MANVNELLTNLKVSKQRLSDLWDIKGITDREVLEAAEEVDQLLNEYHRLFKQTG